MEKVSIAPQMVFCPQPLYIIGTRNEDGTPNFCALSWVTFAWNGCQTVVLSIGEPKVTRTNILREQAFVAHQVGRESVWLADYFGSTSAAKGLKTQMPYGYTWARSVPAPVLDESAWAFECRVTGSVELDGGILILGQVENIQVAAEFAVMDMEHVDLKALDPVIYAPSNYWSVGTYLGNMGEWRQHLSD